MENILVYLGYSGYNYTDVLLPALLFTLGAYFIITGGLCAFKWTRDRIPYWICFVVLMVILPFGYIIDDINRNNESKQIPSIETYTFDGVQHTSTGYHSIYRTRKIGEANFSDWNFNDR